jgi:hypothetical protein
VLTLTIPPPTHTHTSTPKHPYPPTPTPTHACARQAEKVAEKFVANRIKPALQRAQERDIVEVVLESGTYLRGLWDRLNGGGGGGRRALPTGLPMAASSKKEVERMISELGRELESLEKRLQEASKARESKLRKVGGGRAVGAFCCGGRGWWGSARRWPGLLLV